MATSPRPGLIQLDHPNVYMAAKEAQKDNWIRRGINLAGDFFQERNRDIRYRRANGNKEDRSTTEDSLKKLGEGAWGLLKAPFADEAPMAPTVTEDYRTEVGEKKTSPLPEGPSDIIDRPEQILNAPKITTEVDGLPSTQTAEPGVKVSFPTTVAGTVERSKLPDTVVPKPTPQAQDQAPTQASVPQGMLQAPDWSEMFRLDPERAKYDWTRAKDAEAVALGRDKLSQEASVEAAKLAQKAGQASSLEELQQLWKDNNRGLVEARKVQDPVATKMYQENIARLLPLLQEKAPAVWGKAATPASAKTDPATTGAGEGADGTTPKQRAHTEAYTQVDLLTDADKNGTLDNLLAVDRAIKGIRDKYGVSDADMQDVYAQVELAKSKAKEEKEARERDLQIALDNKLKKEAAARSGGAQDERAALLRINKLQKEPTPQNKSDAILWVMRKRSGAKIDPDEFLQYLKGGVDDATYAEITKDLSPSGISVWLGTLIDGKLSESQVRTITDKYAARVNPSFLTEDLGTFVDPDKLNKPPPGGGGGGGGGKPPPGGDVKTDAKGRKYTVDSNGKRNYLK